MKLWNFYVLPWWNHGGGEGESAYHLLPKIQGHEMNVDVKMSLYLNSVIVE